MSGEYGDESQCQASEEIEHHIEVVFLFHQSRSFVHKSREGGESAAEACGQEQAEAAGGGGKSGEQSVQQTDQKTACYIDNERGQRESAGRPDQQRYDVKVCQCSSQETS